MRAWGPMLAPAVLLAIFCDERAAAQFTVADSIGFQVNTSTAYSQLDPAIAAAPSGGFVVVWRSAAAPYIGAQRYDAQGVAVGTELAVTAAMPSVRYAPAVAVQDDGSFVIAAESSRVFGPPSDASSGVFAQRYDADGSAVGGEIHVNTYTSAREGGALVDVTPDGGFIVVWTSATSSTPTVEGEDGDEGGVFGQRFDSAGDPVGTEFAVNTYTTGDQGASAIAVAGDGRFLVAWLDVQGGINGDRTVMGRLFDATATPISAEFQINTGSPRPGASRVPSAGSDASGNFTVVWQEPGDPNTLDTSIVGRRFDSDGVFLGSEFTIAAHLPDGYDHVAPRVSVAEDGHFVVVWIARGNGTNFDAPMRVLASAFDSGGALESGDILLSNFLYTAPSETTVAMTPVGSFMAAWAEALESTANFSSGRDGDRQGVFARRVCRDDDATCRVCAGADNAQNADGDRLSDGCDPCTDVDGLRDVVSRSKLIIKDDDVSPAPNRTNGIAYSVEYSLPDGTSFADFDPLSDGMRWRLATADARAMLDLSLPAGAFAGAGTAGWIASGSGKKWRFRDRTDSSAKVRSLSIVDRSRKTPHGVKLKLKARGFPVDLSGNEVPLAVTTSLGGPSSWASGLCSEVSYAPAECSSKTTKTKCRR
jgi:hypothetical protein